MRICVFGASITWGAWDEEKSGWVDRLKLFYMNEFEEQLYNLGISGDNTDDLLKRFELEMKVRQRESMMVIFAIGTNDSQYVKSLGRNSVLLDKFEKNLQKLINQAKKFTAKIVFIGLNNVDESKTKPIPWNTDKEYSNESIKKYDETIKSICEKNKLNFVPLRGKLSNDLLDDGLHPNTEGHKLIFKTVKDFLIKNKLIEK